MLSGKGFKQFSISLSIMQLSNYTVPIPMKTKSVNYFRCPRHYQKENGIHKLCHKLNVCEGY